MSTPRIIMAFRAACIAAARSLPEAGARADEFFDAISAAPIAATETSGIAYDAFDAVMADIMRLASDRAFDPMMLAGEALAACLLRSSSHDAVARRWLQRDHAFARTTAMRAYSKVADYDASRIAGDAVSALVARLDGMSPLSDVDEVTLSYVARMAGKLRDEPLGIRIIEQLAGLGQQARIAATHAIAFDIALGPPLSTLSVFHEFGPPRVRRDPPNRRLSWLFNSLRHDADPAVVAAAEMNLQLIRQSWPDVWKRMIEMKASGVVPEDRSAAGTPVEYRDSPTARAAVDDALAELRARTGRPWMRSTLATLTHTDLAREGSIQPRGVDFALRFPGQSNRDQGVLTWNPTLLDEDARAERDGDLLPRIPGAPRLFISYRWTDEIAEVGWIDMLAGRLHMSGYDIVFDRDPRHLDKGLSAADVLLLLQGSTHFVPLITEELLAFLTKPRSGPKTPIELEWELARSRERSRTPLRWLVVWLSGDRLPRRLERRLAIDLREISLAAFDRVFPPCRYEVVGIKRDGAHGKARVVDRRHLREAMQAEASRRSVEGIQVRDVTRRPPIWSE